MRSNGAPELIFLNGLTHIGGLQIVLRTGEAELFFDLGLGQTEHAALFNAVVPAGRMSEPLNDYLRAAMVPLADGLYRDDAYAGCMSDLIVPLSSPGAFLENAPRFPESERHRAVFIGHLHSDHAGLLPFLDARQRVFMSSVSAQLQGALERSGVVNESTATIVGNSDGAEVELADIRLTFLDIDHDTPGAMGFIAQTSGGTVAYTGDWRYHGVNPHYMDAFAEVCRGRGVDILITEASTAQRAGVGRWPWGLGVPAQALGGPRIADSPLTESDACEALTEAINDARGLVFLCLHQQHLERVEALGAALEASGRRIVVERRTAAFWLDAVGRGLLELDPSLVLAYEDDPVGPTDLSFISLDEIRATRDGYVCQLSFRTHSAMLALGAGRNDVVVHANGHPLGSQYPGWAVLEDWVKQLQVPLVVIDSHGHAEPDALRTFAKATGARTVIPVHSDHVTEAAVPSELRYLPERWERLVVANVN